MQVIAIFCLFVKKKAAILRTNIAIHQSTVLVASFAKTFDFFHESSNSKQMHLINFQYPLEVVIEIKIFSKQYATKTKKLYN